MKKKIRTKPTQPPTSADDEPLLMRFVSPESGTIVEASYDSDTETLSVMFSNHITYRYDHFPLIMWKEFLEASSKGKYFQNRIRPIFAGVKVA